jgi:hypothetical protein
MTYLFFKPPESFHDIRADPLTQLEFGSSIRQSRLGLFKGDIMILPSVMVLQRKGEGRTGY